jgi:hypothetical protein
MIVNTRNVILTLMYPCQSRAPKCMALLVGLLSEGRSDQQLPQQVWSVPSSPACLGISRANGPARVSVRNLRSVLTRRKTRGG